MRINSHDDYVTKFNNLQAQVREIEASTRDLPPNFLFFAFGKLIQDQEEKWEGKENILVRMFLDLREDLQATKYFTIRDCREMRGIAVAFRPIDGPVVQQAFEQLSWSTLMVIGRLKRHTARLFYLQRACMGGWSRQETVRQINSCLHARTGCLLSNFERLLSEENFCIARNCFNSPVDFHLTAQDLVTDEWSLTSALKKNVDQFLGDLGLGFTYRQTQRRLRKGVLDFLLFHTGLNCNVVVEFKMKKFRSEDIWKMNYYLENTNKYLKEKGQNDAVGLIYCTDMNEAEVLHSVKGSNKPIGVTTFLLDGQSPEERKCENNTGKIVYP